MVHVSQASRAQCRAALRRRREAAKRYRPDCIRVLTVGQMPPDHLDRYFYFPSVPRADYLFQGVVPHLLGEEPARVDKRRQLAALRDLGFFLIDLKPDPCDPTPLDSFVDHLVERVLDLGPEHVILVKVDVYDAAFRPLIARGVPVLDKRLPFPSTGQQGVFAKGFRAALAQVGFESRADEAA